MKVDTTGSQVVAKFSSSWHHLEERFGLIGVCAYLVGFILPLAWDIPLLLLGFFGALAFITESKHTTRSWPPLTLPVLLFIASIGLSTLFSEDIGRSVRLSAALLPALLLFSLISQHLDGTRDTRLLCLTFAAVGLGLATVLLLTAWHYYGDKSLHEVVKYLGIPVLVVPNDVTFLAIVAPLVLALVFHKPRSAVGTLALLSVLVSIGAVCAFQSRTAALTMGITLPCAVILMQPKQRWVCGVMYGVAFLFLAVLIDALLGFPLAAKITRKAAILGRMRYWSTAWEMFREAPLLGHGPHTFGVFHKTPWTHNLYLEVLAEQGIIGLGTLVGLLANGIRMIWRVYRSATGEMQLFSAGVFVALIGFCSAAIFELSLLRQWVVITLFMLVGVVAQLSWHQATTKEET